MIIADQFPCRRTLLTNMTTETAWTAGRSQTTVLPKGFGLKSKSYQYQQSQIQHLLLQPVPPLSVINKLSFSSMKGSLKHLKAFCQLLCLQVALRCKAVRDRKSTV